MMPILWREDFLKLTCVTDVVKLVSQGAMHESSKVYYQ